MMGDVKTFGRNHAQHYIQVSISYCPLQFVCMTLSHSQFGVVYHKLYGNVYYCLGLYLLLSFCDNVLFLSQRWTEVEVHCLDDHFCRFRMSYAVSNELR